MKLLDSSHNPKIQVELKSHADTSVVVSNILEAHYQECYVDVYGYDSKSRHKNITTVDTPLAYDNLQVGDMSVLLINQAILIPLYKNILFLPMEYHCPLMACSNSC